MINTQHLTNSKNSPTSHNDRFMDFLKFALYRIIETAHLYESEAKASKDSNIKLFLYYLAGKKRVQHVILEIIATNNRGTPLSLQNDTTGLSIKNQRVAALADAPYKSIIKFALTRAEKDYSLYTSLAVLEEDSSTKKLLFTLSRLSNEFIKDIKEGHVKFIKNNTVCQ